MTDQPAPAQNGPMEPHRGTPPSGAPGQPGWTSAPVPYPAAQQAVPPVNPVPPQPGYPGQPYPPAYQPPAYQPPPYGAYPAPAYPPRPQSGAAIASLVCGLIAIVLSWLGFPLLAAIPAIITGHVALRQIRQRPELGGRGMAIAGLILGYVVLGFLALLIVVSLLVFLASGAVLLPALIAN